jgi:hypothetical protein
MEIRKVQSKKRYVVSVLIGTFVFVMIILLSSYISQLQFKRVSNVQEDMAYGIFEDKLDYSLFDLGICSQESFNDISKALGIQGRIIDDLEKKLGKNHEGVLFRKKFYTLIELEHFEFVKLLNKECDIGMNTVFFFYSNDKKYLDESEKLGRLLDAFYTRNKNLIIYSFDINLNSELIEKLKKKYSIEQPNTIVLNEDVVLHNPKTLDLLESPLN